MVARKQSTPKKLHIDNPTSFSSTSSLLLRALTILTTSSSTSSTSTSTTTTAGSPSTSKTTAATAVSVKTSSTTTDAAAAVSPPPSSDAVRNPSPLSSPSSISSYYSSFSCMQRPVLSPLPSTPLRNIPLSDKCKQLQSRRKKSFLPLKPCTYVFKKGGKKGEQCVRFSLPDDVVCSLHIKPKEKSNTTLPPHQTVETINTRINRLRKFKKYFFVEVIEHTKVLLRCEDKKYILRLPKGMINPENPTERDYLIRGSCGTAVWKTTLN